MTSDPEFRDRHRRRLHADRAGEQCPRCGRSLDTADRVDDHHHDGDPTNGHPSNLRKRCKNCHLGGEHDRDVETKQPRGPRSGPRRPRTSPR
ncbi:MULTISPECIES: hypothetical protein [Halorussus]|uniref:hypothetical protein n=1 Tax=Halorussus TaxID=1070314 RepID=UPI0020A063DA|nr:hypothetical protein [Halorussus vallis]USZ75651.1 hypothetical protein NGM07_19760 [Halorussus vallis]USZ75705.1 hypothetical protein NGM07_20035 [Halorussus vallis]